MAKRNGLLRHAAKAVKEQQKKAAPGSRSGPGSKAGTKPGSGPPAAKKQKTGNNNNNNNNDNSNRAQQNQKPTIPFSPTDSILLVGEGDLSFAASLISHHRCTNVTATVLEKDYAELSAKYPHVSSNIAVIDSPSNPNCRLLYGIDARKLHPPFTATTTTSKENKQQRQGAMKRIIFNFPHTGGKSTDVNRQVRYNQELLVDFFRRAQHSLAPGGTIVVTLFEGEPYTLWNIRDLARHAGLQVQRSFRFLAAAYPGYGHARTLGVVKNKRGEVARHAWKGEERPARSYVFVRKGEEAEEEGKKKKGSKRKRGGDDGSDSSDEDEDEDENEEGAGKIVESEDEEGWGSGGDENELDIEGEEEDGSPDEPGDGDMSSDGD